MSYSCSVIILKDWGDLPLYHYFSVASQWLGMFLTVGPSTNHSRLSEFIPIITNAQLKGTLGNYTVALSDTKSGDNYSNTRAAIVDEGTQNQVGGKPCGTYVIISMQRSASTTLCMDMNYIDNGTFRCAFEIFAQGYSLKHHYNLDFVSRHPKEFMLQMASVVRMFNPTCVWGFKLFDRQLKNIDPVIREVDKCIVYRCAERPL